MFTLPQGGFQMKKLLTFASTIRANLLLCCGAAVLLSACGAGISDPVTGQPLQTAAAMSSSVDQAGANSGAGSAANIDPRYAAGAAASTSPSEAAGPAANVDPRYAAGGAAQATANSRAIPPRAGDLAVAAAGNAAMAVTASPAPDTAAAGNTPAAGEGSSQPVQTVDAAGNIVEPAASADPAANQAANQAGSAATNAVDPAANAGAPQ